MAQCKRRGCNLQYSPTKQRLRIGEEVVDNHCQTVMRGEGESSHVGATFVFVYRPA